MTRLLSSIRWDITVQFRQGFYLVSGFTILLFTLLFSQVPRDGRLAFTLLIPPLIVLNVMITTFYYIGALVLLEKSEHSLVGVVTTPLREIEYLLAKLCSLTALSSLETILLVVLVYGMHFEPVRMVAGLLLLCAIYTLLGFIVIARYDSINEYLVPSILYALLLALPLLDHFGLWRNVLLYLHPVQPPLTLIRAAFMGDAGWESLYGGAGAMLWLVLLLQGARVALRRIAIREAGGL